MTARKPGAMRVRLLCFLRAESGDSAKTLALLSPPLHCHDCDFPMPSWQSAWFARVSRMARPRTLGLEGDIEELRRQYSYLTDRFGPIPQGATFEPSQVGPVKGEWIRMGDTTTHRLILYFHGGGYVSGSPETHRPLIARLCQAAQAIAFAPSYRLAPEFAFPAGLRDGIDAYRYLLQRKISPSS